MQQTAAAHAAIHQQHAASAAGGGGHDMGGMEPHSLGKTPDGSPERSADGTAPPNHSFAVPPPAGGHAADAKGTAPYGHAAEPSFERGGPVDRSVARSGAALSPTALGGMASPLSPGGDAPDAGVAKVVVVKRRTCGVEAEDAERDGAVRRYAGWCALLNVAGLFLACLNYGLIPPPVLEEREGAGCFNCPAGERSSETKWFMFLQSMVTVLTFGSVVTTALYHARLLRGAHDAARKRALAQNAELVAPSCFHGGGWRERLAPLLIELLIVIPHPVIFYARRRQFTYLLCWMFLRVFSIARWVGLRSPLYIRRFDVFSQEHLRGKYPELVVTWPSTLRTTFIRRPGTTVVLFTGGALFCCAVMVFYAERQRPGYPDGPFYENLADSMWFMFITFTTIGYGDMYPASNLGKLVTCIAGVLGVVVANLVAGVLASRLEPSPVEVEMISYAEKERVMEAKRLAQIRLTQMFWRDRRRAREDVRLHVAAQRNGQGGSRHTDAMPLGGEAWDVWRHVRPTAGGRSGSWTETAERSDYMDTNAYLHTYRGLEPMELAGGYVFNDRVVGSRGGRYEGKLGTVVAQPWKKTAFQDFLIDRAGTRDMTLSMTPEGLDQAYTGRVQKLSADSEYVLVNWNRPERGGPPRGAKLNLDPETGRARERRAWWDRPGSDAQSLFLKQLRGAVPIRWDHADKNVVLVKPGAYFKDTPGGGRDRFEDIPIVADAANIIRFVSRETRRVAAEARIARLACDEQQGGDFDGESMAQEMMASVEKYKDNFKTLEQLMRSSIHQNNKAFQDGEDQRSYMWRNLFCWLSVHAHMENQEDSHMFVERSEAKTRDAVAQLELAELEQLWRQSDAQRDVAQLKSEMRHMERTVRAIARHLGVDAPAPPPPPPPPPPEPPSPKRDKTPSYLRHTASTRKKEQIQTGMKKSIDDSAALSLSKRPSGTALGERTLSSSGRNVDDDGTPLRGFDGGHRSPSRVQSLLGSSAFASGGHAN